MQTVEALGFYCKIVIVSVLKWRVYGGVIVSFPDGVRIRNMEDGGRRRRTTEIKILGQMLR